MTALVTRAAATRLAAAAWLRHHRMTRWRLVNGTGVSAPRLLTEKGIPVYVQRQDEVQWADGAEWSERLLDDTYPSRSAECLTSEATNSTSRGSQLPKVASGRSTYHPPRHRRPSPTHNPLFLYARAA